MASSPTKEFTRQTKKRQHLIILPCLALHTGLPPIFFLPTNFTNKLPNKENIPENHLAYRNQSWEVESGSYSSSLRM